MERSLASEIVDAVLSLDTQLNDLDTLLRGVPDAEEQKLLLKTVAKVILELDAGLIRPLVRQHPDLEPG